MFFRRKDIPSHKRDFPERMEDGLYIKPNGELALDNAQQVAKLKEILELLDYEIADSEEARAMLCLKGKEEVAF